MKIIPALILSAFAFAPGLAWPADERLSDLVLQLQRLQQEMQQLRGQVEMQQYQLDTLKKQQQDQYLDLDGRLRGQGAGAAAAPSQPAPRAQAPADAQAPERPTGSALDLGATGGGAAAVQLPPEKDAYRAAFDLLKERRYDEAVKAFQDLLAVYPNGEFADNAHYWLGETYYVKRDYSGATAEFQFVLDNYPLSPKVPGAMLKLGYTRQDQGDWQGARTSFQEVIQRFPDSTEARLAQSRLERMAKDGR